MKYIIFLLLLCGCTIDVKEIDISIESKVGGIIEIEWKPTIQYEKYRIYTGNELIAELPRNDNNYIHVVTNCGAYAIKIEGIVAGIVYGKAEGFVTFGMIKWNPPEHGWTPERYKVYLTDLLNHQLYIDETEELWYDPAIILAELDNGTYPIEVRVSSLCGERESIKSDPLEFVWINQK